MTELKNKLHNLKFRLSYYYSTYAFEKKTPELMIFIIKKYFIEISFSSPNENYTFRIFFPIDTIGDIPCLPRSVVNAYYFIVIQL